MVKKWPPLYQKMLSFTYCKQPLLYHRKFSLTQLSSRSYIIGSSPLTQCRRPLLCKRVLSPRYECGRIYIKGHSLYLLWVATPISILNNEGGLPFTSAHFQKAATSGFIIWKGVMAKWFLLSQRNMWLEGLPEDTFIPAGVDSEMVEFNVICWLLCILRLSILSLASAVGSTGPNWVQRVWTKLGQSSSQSGILLESRRDGSKNSEAVPWR